MIKTHTLLTIAVFLASFITAWAQAEVAPGNTIDYNNVQMSGSPSTASFGNVNEIGVNSALGLPNISIPLYTFEMDGVSIPISISYNASGIKVNQLATSVGLGWSLEAGGQFTRTVRAKTDEFDGILGGWGPISDSQYADYDPNDPELWQNSMKGFPTQYNGWARKHDHYPDLFGYSFLGITGNFIYNPHSGEIIKDKTDGIKILWDEGAEDKFEAIDLAGNKFEFLYSDTEKSNNKNIYVSNGDMAGDNSIEWEDGDGNIPPTAWKLSNITTKNNKLIEFKYDSINMHYTIGAVESHITIGKTCDPTNNQKIKRFQHTTTTYKLTAKLIKKISSPDGNIEVVFNYSSDENLPEIVWNTQLQNVIVTDLSTGKKREFRFEYSRIDYFRLRLDKLYEVGYNENNQEVEKPSYLFYYNGGPIPRLDSFEQDFFGYFNNSGELPRSLVPITTVTSEFQSFFTQNSRNRNLDPNSVDHGVLTEIQYPLGGSVHLEFEPNAVETTWGTKYCGGLRIRSIENRDDTVVYNKKLFLYEGLNGVSLGNHDLTTKYEGNTKSYYSSFVQPTNHYQPGYFYDKVTIITSDNNSSESHKEEHYFEQNNYSLHKMDYALKKKMFYLKNQTEPIKIIEYVNDTVGTPSSVRWNVLGDMKCYGTLNGGYSLGYNENQIEVEQIGNYAFMPTKIITTEYLEPNRSAVTSIEEIEYDPNTLLKTKEITDTGDEIITTNYQYPWSDGINLQDLPKALPISKIVHSNKHENGDPIFGQFFEYDTLGNIKRTFRFNKGEVGNTSSPGYVPIDYEEMTNFLFKNGKPVQVFQKSGEATTYVWGLNNQYPVAKIEGKARAGIDQSKLQAVENASYGQLPAALDELRNDGSVQGAMVTTYTYRPLAGVETITDPKGDKITYHYDAFGRLKKVTDKDGNILSENEYHYAD